MDENNGICLLDERKRIKRPGKIKDVKKKIYARARKVLLRLLRPRGLVEFKKVASGSSI